MSSTTEENDEIMEAEAASMNSEIFTEALVDQVNKEDVSSMVEIQTDMLSRYEKTNEMLINFNMLSLARYEATSKEFKQHTQVLYDMKKDLDNVFRRIRLLKQRLGSMYPDAFAACSDVYNILEEEEDDGARELKESDQQSTKHNSSELDDSSLHKYSSDVASSMIKVTSPNVLINIQTASDNCNFKHKDDIQCHVHEDDNSQNSDINDKRETTCTGVDEQSKESVK